MVLSSTSYGERLKSSQKEYTSLAEEHLKHDLTPSDRSMLETAAYKAGLHTSIGAGIGLGVGLFLSFRLRQRGHAIYAAAKSAEKPTAIQFADGRTIPFPDTTDFFKPTTAGQVLMGFLFGTAGFFLGGEIGLLTGSASASRHIEKDPQARGRIEAAFRNFRIDVLRSQVAALEKGKASSSPGFASSADGTAATLGGPTKMV